MTKSNEKTREKKIVTTSIIGILGNLLLVGFKITIGLIVNAISLISDGINNLTDALSSLITIIGTKIANKKPDKKHPYGHGRFEYLTSLIISVLVIIAGATAIVEAVTSLINGDMIAKYNLLSLIIISVGILIKAALGIFFRIRGKKYDSDALKASGVDAIGDVILSTATLVVAIICYFVPDAAKIHLEAYLSIVIGLFIIKAGVEILLEAVSNIIGKRTDQSVINEMKTMVCSFPQVQGAYDLILNNYGPERIIGSVHIQVDDNLTAKEIHKLTREIQTKAFNEHNIILTVGIYANNDSDDVTNVKKDLLGIIKKYPEVIQTHGFFLDSEKHIVTFDIIIDFKSENHPKTIEKIKEEIKQLHPEYDYYVIEDLDISD